MTDLIQNISYIIGFRQSNEERKIALIFVLKNLRKYFPNLEIIIVEQDDSPKLQIDANLNIHQFFIKNSEAYNRGWAFNVAVKQTEKNIFVFADADIFLSKEEYLLCFEATQKFEAITPTKTKATNISISSHRNLAFEKIGQRELFTFAGGIVILTKNAFEKIGGWDERFEGWGGEDGAFSHVIFNMLISKTFDFEMFHIDHPRTELDGKQQPKYFENRKLDEEIQSMNNITLDRYIKKLKNIRQGNPNKYSTSETQTSKENDDIQQLKFVLAITTFNRLDFLKSCIESFQSTKSQNISWEIIIADDGSTDGTKEYLANLKLGHQIKYIKNKNVGIIHQVNSILKYLSTIDFDLCFKIDDDIFFQKEGWDILYWKTIERTGYDHLIFYDKKWQPHSNLERPISAGDLISNCLPEIIQGAFYTLTPRVISEVGFFDEQRFGAWGLGHVDYSFRCCRAGFNVLKNPFDVKNSNDYILLQKYSESSSKSISAKYKSLLNPKEIIEFKKDVFRSNRIYIPYNENIIPLNLKKDKTSDSKIPSSTISRNSKYKKADATFYSERGVLGFIGFLIKRFYNFSIDYKLFFIPKLIKSLGRVLNKISIDFLNIED